MEQGLAWQSLQWPDGTRYEGLTKEGKLHSHGVLMFPNKDRYEGEFDNGRMHGFGVYVWNNGTIYRGDWNHGMMHGCGTQLWKQKDGEVVAAEGKFFGSAFIGDVMPCSKQDAFDSAVEADVAALQARSFTQWRTRLQGPRQTAWSNTTPLQQTSGLQQSQGRPSAAPTRDDNARGPPLDDEQQRKVQGLLQRLAYGPFESRQ